jgi:gallate decarboxylase subunit D
LQNKIITFSEGDSPYRVSSDAVEIGADLLVTIYGGEKPHVGAIAIGIPRPSLADTEQISATVSVFTLTGHKEDDLAKMMAGKITAALRKVTVLTVGIHVDNITVEGLKTIEENAHKVLERLLDYFIHRDSKC